MKIKSLCLTCRGNKSPCPTCNGEGWVYVNSVEVGGAMPEPGPVHLVGRSSSNMNKIVDAVRDYQKAYLQTLDIRDLRPMRLKDIAEITKLDSATICTKIKGKMIDGIEMKSLFSASFSGTSNKIVQKILEEIISDEQHEQSDSELVVAMKEKGVTISRRTIVKYRQILRIGTAKSRKK